MNTTYKQQLILALRKSLHLHEQKRSFQKDNVLKIRMALANQTKDEGSESSDARSIDLPSDPVFRNLENATRFAIDIGGSLAKLAYSSAVPMKKASVICDGKADTKLGMMEYEGIKLEFIKFETKYLCHCLDFIKDRNLLAHSTWDGMNGRAIKATGGGAHKYTDLITNKLGFKVDKEDEMACLIKGCNFLLRHIPNEVFLYQHHGNPEYRFMQSMKPDNMFPYLLVNIGSGVSIVKVESDVHYERIGGTSIGGGTFWGLGSLLTKAKGFDDLLTLAERGDHRSIDLLVKDIYGGAYTSLGLPGDLIASSFGKAVRASTGSGSGAGDDDSAAAESYSDVDIARSLLISISNDIGQIACLNAKLHGLKNIYFGGYFIRGHPLTMRTISYAINYWSKGEISALFLRHEGYLGAIGAFLKGTEEEYWCEHSWGENYVGSSGLRSPAIPASQLFMQDDATVSRLELDQLWSVVTRCPLLDERHSYTADTVDLTLDHDARTHWLHVFISTVDKVVERAVSSQPHHTDATHRAQRFRDKFLQRLFELQDQPCSYGSLTMRSILDMREHYLCEFAFPDIYQQQKLMENESALLRLPSHLSSLARLTRRERLRELVLGLLAGNVFDWGAREVAHILEAGELDFDVAKGKLQSWLWDDYDEWVEALESKTYKCAAIFVDNSGVDIVLGVFPLVVELLSRGTRVILCANTRPALNDITYTELVVLTNQVAAHCGVVERALRDSPPRLTVMETGSGSPCLDLTRLASDLSSELVSAGVDLLILEGMGRAIHTNLNARFTCDALKVAVIKDRWFAERLGGDMFSVMFKFEAAATSTATAAPAAITGQTNAESKLSS